VGLPPRFLIYPFLKFELPAWIKAIALSVSVLEILIFTLAMLLDLYSNGKTTRVE
jgi:hypothetical protein